MRTRLRACLAISAFTVLCGTASAQMPVYYRAGSWDAFSGTDTSGNTVCGVGTTIPTDNRSLSIRYQIGGDGVLFQAKKPGWNIPAGTQLSVVLQIGLDTPWNMQGTGNAQSVEWTLSREAMPTFDAQFRRASSMTMTFPSGNEPPWTLGLSGSTAISNVFGRCVNDMARRTATPAQAPAGPTQPFGQDAAQPAGQDTTQPAAPR